ncbi:hypothetical protein AGMMS49975_18830 [Clostridia bacterium]|nr:hypothetical protein AGMMS49975_18830 [Clostridia bacterium]
MPDNVIIGVNMLETLTTGMYRDAKVIFREYIQNSCDQIDEAVDTGLLKQNEGTVEIWIEDDSVFIEDNATGIPTTLFKEKLYNIGKSDKSPERSRGFRGIGHWCGFAHCKSLIFKSKANGEAIESVMACDAEKMRSMMLECRLKRADYSIDDVLSSTTEFFENPISDLNSHYFKVEMYGIVDAKEELCNLQNVKEYLSFIIPVKYAPEFHFRNQIHKYANKIEQHIEEYDVRIKGEAVFKKYQPSFDTRGKGSDTITSVQFKEFRDDKSNLVAWMWFGVSAFKAQIIPASKMRGIRLRSRNIQIGEEDALQKLFNESNGRGLYYYIGEVFAVSTELLPDSQRDYFEPGNARTQFERFLFEFFNSELRSIYYAGSKIGSATDKILKVEKIKSDIEALGESVTGEKISELEHAIEDAEKANQELTKIREKNETKLETNECGTAEIVINKILKSNAEKLAPSMKPAKPTTSGKIPPKMTDKTFAPTDTTVYQQNSPLASMDKLVSLSKIREIIRKSTDSSIADAIIAKIDEELN